MPRPRSEKARQAVLAAMRRAVAEDGYASVTIEGLAADAGVAKQTIYRWWPGKAEVLGEALLDGSLPGTDAMVPQTADLEGDLRAWFTKMSGPASGSAGREVGRALITVAVTDPELGLALNARLTAPIREWVKTRLRQAVEDGDAREDVDADTIAEHFVAVASFVALVNKPMTAQEVDGTVAMLMRGVAAR